jgi:hypothetical protein
MEGARRATGISSVSNPAAGGRELHTVADPEVPEKAARRRFPAVDKLRIFKEAEACQGTSQCGDLLRREGLYSSHLTTWEAPGRKRIPGGPFPSETGPEGRAS